jgi:hypothetical protein
VRVGTLIFYPDDVELPENRLVKQGAYEYINLHYHVSRFQDIYHILMHEKPLYIHFSEDSKDGWIGTSEKEPVGTVGMD